MVIDIRYLTTVSAVKLQEGRSIQQTHPTKTVFMRILVIPCRILSILVVYQNGKYAKHATQVYQYLERSSLALHYTHLIISPSMLIYEITQ